MSTMRKLLRLERRREEDKEDKTEESVKDVKIKEQGNKAEYTATSVACGWAGAVFELLKHLARSSEAKDRKNIKKVKWGPTDRPTDKAGYRVA